MISQKEFEKKCSEFNIIEPRWGVYDRSLNLIANNYRTEGALLLNAVWNIATFRYYSNKFDVASFDDAISKVYPIIQGIDKKFENADFKKLEPEINKTYTPLSNIGGVDYTGATKIMHLFKPDLFVLWDQYIREKYLGKTKQNSVNDYIMFLEKMQKEFGHLKAPDGKTLPKAIDEYNYVVISVPAVDKAKKDRKKIADAKKEMRKDPKYKDLVKEYLK